jgi:hypothetical protein
MRIKTVLFVLPTLAIAGASFKSAIASSPDAMAQHQKEVIFTCLAASGFRNARPIGEIIVFGDDVGYDALRVRGNYPQIHMNNQAGKVLCLFDRSVFKSRRNISSWSMGLCLRSLAGMGAWQYWHISGGKLSGGRSANL